MRKKKKKKMVRVIVIIFPTFNFLTLNVYKQFHSLYKIFGNGKERWTTREKNVRVRGISGIRIQVVNDERNETEVMK